MSDEKVVNGGLVFDAEDGEHMNEKIQKDLLADRQAKFDGLPAGTVLVPLATCPTCGCSNAGGIDELCPCECHGGTFSEEDRENMRIHDDTPHGEDPLDRLPAIVESVPTYNSEETTIPPGAACRRISDNETWEHFIARRIRDEPDAHYREQHQGLEDWVRQHSLPEGVTQEQYDEASCAERERMQRELPTGLLTVHGYLWRDGLAHDYFLDSKGRKFHVDDWERDIPLTVAQLKTRGSEASILRPNYVLHHPRVAPRPDLGPDECGLSLEHELAAMNVMARADEQVSLVAVGLDVLVGKRVRVSCTVDCIRETYYGGDGCYDRVYLVPMGEAFEVDLFGRAEEECNSKATIVNFDDELDELTSEETKE